METIQKNRKNIGLTIKTERKKQTLTQYDLCLSTGISLRTLNKIENGQSNYSTDTLILICKKLGMNKIDII